MKATKNGLLSLDAAQASITTATVTIRTLRVNNKQLTQATFRQLPERPLLDQSVPEILGTIWGWVNYQPPGAVANHRQFVVQFGEELCRCPFHVRKISYRQSDSWNGETYEWFDYFARTCKIFILSRAIDGSLEVKSDPNESRFTFNLRSRPFFGMAQVAVGYQRDLDDKVGNGIRDKYSPHRMRTKHRQVNGKWMPYEEMIPDEEVNAQIEKGTRALKEAFESRVAVEDLTKPSEWWDRELDRIAMETESYVQRWNEMMNRLGTVPQLFIAC